MKKKVLFIYNPVSGKANSETRVQLLNELESNNYEVTEFTTSIDHKHNDEAYKSAANYDVVLCAGGDGTLHNVVNGLIKYNVKTPIHYFPSGTTNDFAKSLNIPNKVTESIELLNTGSVKQIDVGKFNGDHYFTYIATIGSFSDVSYTTDQKLKNSFGHNAYIIHGLLNLFDQLKSVEATITTDDKTYNGEFLFCSISNSTSIAGIISLDKSQVLFNDGLFEVMLIQKPKNSDELLKIIRALITNSYQTTKTKGIIYFNTSKLTISTKEETPWTLDGEFGGNYTDITIEVVKDKFRIIH